MRSVVRLSGVLLALASLTVVFGMWSIALASSEPASLRVVKLRPLTVRGDHFRPGERVQVRASGAHTAGATVVARPSGVLTVRFPLVVFDGRCAGAVEIMARGDRGSLARARLVTCPPTIRRPGPTAGRAE
jgi:hypothetical protein